MHIGISRQLESAGLIGVNSCICLVVTLKPVNSIGNITNGNYLTAGHFSRHTKVLSFLVVRACTGSVQIGWEFNTLSPDLK